MSTLPDKASALIRVALRDLEAVESDDRYTVQMSLWHDERKSGGCAVCFAGAVMAKSLGAVLGQHYDPRDFKGDEQKLTALNELRSGRVGVGLTDLGLDDNDEHLWAFDRSIADYKHSPADFKADMRALADDLEKAGL